MEMQQKQTEKEFTAAAGQETLGETGMTFLRLVPSTFKTTLQLVNRTRGDEAAILEMQPDQAKEKLISYWTGHRQMKMNDRLEFIVDDIAALIHLAAGASHATSVRVLFQNVRDPIRIFMPHAGLRLIYDVSPNKQSWAISQIAEGTKARLSSAAMSVDITSIERAEDKARNDVEQKNVFLENLAQYKDELRDRKDVGVSALNNDLFAKMVEINPFLLSKDYQGPYEATEADVNLTPAETLPHGLAYGQYRSNGMHLENAIHHRYRDHEAVQSDEGFVLEGLNPVGGEAAVLTALAVAREHQQHEAGVGARARHEAGQAEAAHFEHGEIVGTSPAEGHAGVGEHAPRGYEPLSAEHRQGHEEVHPEGTRPEETHLAETHAAEAHSEEPHEWHDPYETDYSNGIPPPFGSLPVVKQQEILHQMEYLYDPEKAEIAAEMGTFPIAQGGYFAAQNAAREAWLHTQLPAQLEAERLGEAAQENPERGGPESTEPVAEEAELGAFATEPPNEPVTGTGASGAGNEVFREVENLNPPPPSESQISDEIHEQINTVKEQFEGTELGPSVDELVERQRENSGEADSEEADSEEERNTPPAPEYRADDRYTTIEPPAPVEQVGSDQWGSLGNTNYVPEHLVIDHTADYHFGDTPSSYLNSTALSGDQADYAARNIIHNHYSSPESQASVRQPNHGNIFAETLLHFPFPTFTPE